MLRAQEILKTVREKTQDIILFSSVVGKDSILLTYYCAEIFRRVHSVYMYNVKNLRYIQKMQEYYSMRFPNVKFMDLPHYALATDLKTGYLGVKKKEDQKFYTLADIDRVARDKTGINWSVYGMKKNDSMNRRLQLNGYKDGICWQSNKAYPLMDYSNKQILAIIDYLRLPTPMSYAKGGQSSGENVESPDYLYWLYKNYPDDLISTFKMYPASRVKFYEAFGERIDKELYDVKNERKKAKGAKRTKTAIDSK